MRLHRLVEYCLIFALLSACGEGPSEEDDLSTGGTKGSGGQAAAGGSLVQTGGANGTLASGGKTNSGGQPAGGGQDAVGAGGDPSGGQAAGGDNPGTGGNAPGIGGNAPGAGGNTSTAPQAYQDNCEKCHGSDGIGDPKNAPAIAGATSEMTTYLVRFGDQNETVTAMDELVGHAETMDALDASTFSDQDIQDTLSWLASLPRPTSGAELFGRYCSYCHGANGKGGNTEYASAYHSAPFSRRDLASFTSYVQTGNVMEMGTVVEPSERRKYMPPFSNVLSPAEISLIYSWTQVQ